jgi:hypothetical protein
MSGGSARQCLNCGSARLIRGVSLEDSAMSGGNAKIHAISFATRPEALIFTEKVYGDVTGVVCGQCGYIAFFASNPEELYAQYIAAFPEQGRE